MSLYEGLNEGSFKKSTVRRLPICFCLDVSGSMITRTQKGTPRVQEMNEAFQRFIETMKENEAVAEAADIAVLTFGGTVRIEQNMMPINKMPQTVYKVRPKSFTPLGEVILNAVQLLELRKEAYKKRGMKYYQPWLVILTDGEPEGPDAMFAMDEAVKKVRALEEEQKLVVFPVAVADDVSFSELGRLSARSSGPIRMDAEKLDSFFQFLNASSTQVVVKEAPVHTPAFFPGSMQPDQPEERPERSHEEKPKADSVKILEAGPGKEPEAVPDNGLQEKTEPSVPEEASTEAAPAAETMETGSGPAPEDAGRETGEEVSDYVGEIDLTDWCI